MNPLHMEQLAHDRGTEFRRFASSSGRGGRAMATETPDPRIPRRGPLSSILRLSLLVRQAVA